MSFMFFRKSEPQAAIIPQSLCDAQANSAKYKEDQAKLFKFADKNFGKKPATIMREFWKIRKGPGKLSIEEYFLYQLYNDEKYSMEDKLTFLSDEQHWPITLRCSDLTRMGLTEDKFSCDTLVKHYGFASPETIAVIDQGSRFYGPLTKLSTPDALKGFLSSDAPMPLFCKVNSGIGSYGVFIITGVDGDTVLLDQAEPVSFEKLFQEIIGDKTYVVQKALVNHPDLARFSKYVATVRMVNMVDKDKVRTPFACIKIPSPTSIADNYWRSGNLMADIDVETGELLRAVSGKGIDLVEHESHPDLDEKIVGSVLPHWDALRRLNSDCAQAFASQRYQSLDIAITETGPVIVEVNTGSSFELPQLASGKGFLTEEVTEFFRSCGNTMG